MAGKVAPELATLLERRLERLTKYCDDDLRELVTEVHETVLRLGGPGMFGWVFRAAIADPKVSADVKAQMMLGLLNAWTVTALMYQRVEHDLTDQLSDQDLLDKVEIMIRMKKALTARKPKNRGKSTYKKRLAPRGRPPKSPEPGNFYFIGPVAPRSVRPAAAHRRGPAPATGTSESPTATDG